MFFPHLVGDACSREPHQLGERVPINAVVLALSAPATTAARACAQGRRAVVRKALGTSKSIPRRRTPLWPSHATSGLDRQRSAPRFHAALRDSELSAAPALGRRIGLYDRSAKEPLSMQESEDLDPIFEAYRELHFTPTRFCKLQTPR
jgi:hypothetical protein